MFKDATIEEINDVVEGAWSAFLSYRNSSFKQRASFMRAIADEIGQLANELVKVAGEETHLPEPRLRSELSRTQFQLKSYADACESGTWMDIRIDTAVTEKNPLKPDLRKTMIPLGPVAVFGAANFPFAYSTAGGDTASAFAAGCAVVVKAHPAHARTSELVTRAIVKAAANSYMPAGIFSHVHGVSFEVGKALVEHDHIKAVGFTGSFAGGKQLFDWANQRREPIPVFAEMSSVNPVFLLPEKISTSAQELSKMYASSITLGVGQFCTNPGLLVGIDNNDLDHFLSLLSDEIRKASPAEMLHSGIFKNYVETRANALAQPEVEVVAIAEQQPLFNQGLPTIASVRAENYLSNPLLHHEVFGPYSLVIRCRDMEQMLEVAQKMEGQLTVTLLATQTDLKNYERLVETLKFVCGRFILNGVPTGVEVCWSMQHGGPFPASTDSRFGSVGADAIRRFARPVSFQNWNDISLPDELKNENPLQIWRMVNGEFTNQAINGAG